MPRASWTVDEFCSSVGISRSTYERAKREGWGPREMVLGRTGIRIADEAKAAWIVDREEKAASIAANKRERENQSEPPKQDAAPKRGAAFLNSDRRTIGVSSALPICRSDLSRKRGHRYDKRQTVVA